MSIALLLHVFAVVVWVGGMFFAHVALRPAAAATLEPPQRLTLMAAALARFFAWVAVSIAVLLVTGFALIAALGGFAAVGGAVHAMAGIGVVMTLIFVELRLRPYRRLRAAVAAKAWADAGAALAGVRQRVAVNLVLGIVTIAVAVLGQRGV